MPSVRNLKEIESLCHEEIRRGGNTTIAFKKKNPSLSFGVSKKSIT